MTNRREQMRRQNREPDFAAARDAAAPTRLATHKNKIQARANLVKRAVDVPPEMEGAWNGLTRSGYTAKDAALELGLIPLGNPRRLHDPVFALRRISELANEALDGADPTLHLAAIAQICDWPKRGEE